jgi:very-short-patch-repair endonuclease
MFKEKEIRRCLCGCNEMFECSFRSKKRYLDLHFQKNIASNIYKNKTLKERWGLEKYNKWKEKRRQTRLGKKLNRIKPSYKKGMKYEEIYGKEKKVIILQKIKEKCLNTIIWEKQEIINAYLKLPVFRKSEWNKFRKKGILPDSSIVRKLFGSFDNFEIQSNKKFLSNYKREYKHLGENEKEILDIIEKENNIMLERNYKICVGRKKYFVDGYDKENNVVYEIDEEYHKYYQYFDYKRERDIISKLNCKIIRINEEEFLKNHNIYDKTVLYAINEN